MKSGDHSSTSVEPPSTKYFGNDRRIGAHIVSSPRDSQAPRAPQDLPG